MSCNNGTTKTSNRNYHVKTSRLDLRKIPKRMQLPIRRYHPCVTMIKRGLHVVQTTESPPQMGWTQNSIPSTDSRNSARHISMAKGKTTSTTYPSHRVASVPHGTHSIQLGRNTESLPPISWRQDDSQELDINLNQETVGQGLVCVEPPKSHPTLHWRTNEIWDTQNHWKNSFPLSKKNQHRPASTTPLYISYSQPISNNPPRPPTSLVASSRLQHNKMLQKPFTK